MVDHHVGRSGVERLGDGPVNRLQRSSSRQPSPNSPQTPNARPHRPASDHRPRNRSHSGCCRPPGHSGKVNVDRAVTVGTPTAALYFSTNLHEAPHGEPTTPRRTAACAQQAAILQREKGAPQRNAARGVDDPRGAAPARARSWSASRTPYLQQQPVDQVSPDLSATELDMLSRSFRPAQDLALGAGPRPRRRGAASHHPGAASAQAQRCGRRWAGCRRSQTPTGFHVKRSLRSKPRVGRSAALFGSPPLA